MENRKAVTQMYRDLYAPHVGIDNLFSDTIQGVIYVSPEFVLLSTYLFIGAFLSVYTIPCQFTPVCRHLLVSMYLSYPLCICTVHIHLKGKASK